MAHLAWAVLGLMLRPAGREYGTTDGVFWLSNSNIGGLTLLPPITPKTAIKWSYIGGIGGYFEFFEVYKMVTYVWYSSLRVSFKLFKSKTLKMEAQHIRRQKRRLGTKAVPCQHAVLRCQACRHDMFDTSTHMGLWIGPSYEGTRSRLEPQRRLQNEFLVFSKKAQGQGLDNYNILCQTIFHFSFDWQLWFW